MPENSELIAELRKQIKARDEQLLAMEGDLKKFKSIQHDLWNVIPEFDAQYRGDAESGVKILIALIRNMKMQMKAMTAEIARSKAHVKAG